MLQSMNSGKQKRCDKAHPASPNGLHCWACHEFPVRNFLLHFHLPWLMHPLTNHPNDCEDSKCQQKEPKVAAPHKCQPSRFWLPELIDQFENGSIFEGKLQPPVCPKGLFLLALCWLVALWAISWLWLEVAFAQFDLVRSGMSRTKAELCKVWGSVFASPRTRIDITDDEHRQRLNPR